MRTWLTAVLCVAVALAGCSADTGGGAAPPPRVRVTPPPSPSGITMSFLQQRVWEGTRRVGPTSTLDLRFRLPPPDCAADPAIPATGVVVAGDRTVRRVIDEPARSQASQQFTFRFGLLIGDASVPVSMVVMPDAAGQEWLLEFLDRACAGSPSTDALRGLG